jgi:hypothetical protein
MALKNTAMNNQRNHLAKLEDTSHSTLSLFSLKNISNVHIYGFNQDRISLPIQINSLNAVAHTTLSYLPQTQGVSAWEIYSPSQTNWFRKLACCILVHLPSPPPFQIQAVCLM